MLLHGLAERRGIVGIGHAVLIAAEIVHGQAAVPSGAVGIGTRKGHHTKLVRSAEQSAVFAEQPLQIADLICLHGDARSRVVDTDDAGRKALGMAQQIVRQPQLARAGSQIMLHQLVVQRRFDPFAVRAVGVACNDVIDRQVVTGQLAALGHAVAAEQAVGLSSP